MTLTPLLAADISGSIQVTLAVITIVAGVIVYLFQRRQNLNNRFNSCATSLHENNEEAQISSAILLRSFLTKKYYKRDTLNLISALLRVIPYGNLQKTLGDGLSYVGNADGMDLQETKLHKLSVRSKWSIRKELSGSSRPCRLQSFRRVDFFRADITESSFYHVNFDRSVFYDAILSDSSFHYCRFADANFREADLYNVTFDQCYLDRVDFSAALHVESARVKLPPYEKKPEHPELIYFLDENGIYDKYHDEIVFNPKKSGTGVFVSHLGMMDATQSSIMRDIKGWLGTSFKVNFFDIERKNYRDSGQLRSIRNAMSRCKGVVIMAFSYLNVDSGSIHQVKGNVICSIKDVSFSSPWLQVEASIARSLDLPCLIIIQEGVQHTGLFDDKLVKNDDGMFMVEFKGSTVTLSEEDQRLVQNWYKQVSSK